MATSSPPTAPKVNGGPPALPTGRSAGGGGDGAPDRAAPPDYAGVLHPQFVVQLSVPLSAIMRPP